MSDNIELCRLATFSGECIAIVLLVFNLSLRDLSRSFLGSAALNLVSRVLSGLNSFLLFSKSEELAC